MAKKDLSIMVEPLNKGFVMNIMGRKEAVLQKTDILIKINDFIIENSKDDLNEFMVFVSVHTDIPKPSKE